MSLSTLSRRVVDGALLTFLLLGISGCGFSSVEATTPDNSCVSDADCVQGFCAGEICVDDSSTEVTIAIEVLRGPSDTNTQRATPASWAFAPESFSAASERDYVLPPTRPVIGVVRWQGIQVPATLRFTRRLAEPVAALSAVPVEVDTLRTPGEAGDASEVDFSTVLARGEAYDVVIEPRSDLIETADQTAAAIRSLPPIYTSLQLDDVADGALQFDVLFADTLDEECAENELIGCTLTGTVLSFDGLSEAAAIGLQVRAIEKESGRIVSSTGVTDQFGEFAVRVSDQAGPYVIRVTPGVGGPPFPSVSVDPDLAFVNDPTKRRIHVPRVDGVQVTGAVRDGEQRAVRGATVQFSSNGIFEESALGLEGTFSASTTTSDDGSFSAMLLPGLYTVHVTPPTDTANVWAPLSGEAFVVAEVSELEDLVLPSQIALSGSCTTFKGEPARGVTVLARARAEAGGLQRSRLTASNLEGTFRLTVDAGRYDMFMQVADATGFPWLVEPELIMSAERGEIIREYTLPPPVVVRGTLQTADGAIVGGAEIRAYVFESDADGVRPIQVAQTVSAADGTYRLLISPTLGE